MTTVLRPRYWRLASWWRWSQQLPATTADALIAAFVALIEVLEIAAAHNSGARPADAGAYALGLAGSLPLAVRRRLPLLVVAVTAAAQSIYNMRHYPGALPFGLLIALYTAAAIGWRQRSLLVGVAVIATLILGRAFAGEGRLVSSDTVLYSAIGAAVLFLGDAVRSRRALLAEAQERVRRAELEQEAEARRRVTEERLRIARELHDVLAHTITVITVQAGVAADVLDRRPDQARAALETIRQASRDATRELRATLGVLRREEDRDASDASREPAPGLGQVGGLVEMASAAGLSVELRVGGEACALPAAVDLTAYRIVQEALTNVLKHAGAHSAAVAIQYAAGAVTVEVVDDGEGSANRPAGEPAGHGLAGMAERAAAIGGAVEAGPAPGGGFRVRARLPLDGAPA